MTRAKDLNIDDRVIYYGYSLPRRRGELARIIAVLNEKEVIIIFDSDNFDAACNPGHLKKVILNNNNES